MSTQPLEATVRLVAVMRPDGSPLSAPLDEVEVTWEGFEGDRHAAPTMLVAHGNKNYPRGTEVRNTRQVSLLAIEEMAEVAAALGVPEVRPEWIGANLALEGLPELTRLPRGARLVFSGGAGIVIEEENFPCTSAGRSVESHYPGQEGLSTEFVKAARGKRGLVGWVERPGSIRVGDKVQVKLSV